jgi:Ring finger domain
MKPESPIVDDQQIVNFKSFSRTSTKHGSNSHVRERSLFLFGTATGSICSLSPEIFFFEQDPNTGQYFWNSEKNDAVRNIYSAYNFTALKTLNETNITTSSRTITARACLCTLFGDRPVEFCSSEFVSCNVRSNPVTCFSLSSTDTFIESFWPVLFFLVFIIVYALYFTEAGKAARQYCRRKLLYGKMMQRMWGGTSHLDSNDSDLFMERTLDHMIEHNPSRVSNIYRERIYRERRQLRYDQRREQLCWYKMWRNLRSFFANFICCTCKPVTTVELRSNDNTEDNVRAENSNAVEAAQDESPLGIDSASRISSPYAHRLSLKTKVYHEASANPAVNPLTETSLPMEPATSSVAVPATSWSLSSVFAPSHRAPENENIGIQEMDDEVEHGIRCAICLIRLRDGIDIVGDIPCNHCMHKHCLKEWLARKNRCPLCQLPDIADRQQPVMVNLSPEVGSHSNPVQN